MGVVFYEGKGSGAKRSEVNRSEGTTRCCVRIVVGGDKLIYDSDSGSPTVDIKETKILFNSIISDAKHGAKFCSMDLKDMFLHAPMTQPEYMRVLYKDNK